MVDRGGEFFHKVRTAVLLEHSAGDDEFLLLHGPSDMHPQAF